MLTISSQIHEIIQQRVAKRSCDVVGIIEHLLPLASRLGEIRCTLADSDKLRFEIPDQESLEIPLEQAKGRLRAMCARLAYLRKLSGQEFDPYGGEGMIKGSAVTGQPDHDNSAWHVRYKNTTGAQEFTITAVEDADSCR